MPGYAHIATHVTIAGKITYHAKGMGRHRRSGLCRHSSCHGGSHHRYLMVLLRDDVLSEAPKLVVVSVFELGARHIDCALMVRDHHRDEVAIYGTPFV